MHLHDLAALALLYIAAAAPLIPPQVGRAENKEQGALALCKFICAAGGIKLLQLHQGGSASCRCDYLGSFLC
jgi:hypothetical protein